MATNRGGGDSVRVDIDVEADAQDARDAATEVVRVLRSVFERAFNDIGDELAHALNGQAVRSATRNLGADLKDAAGSGRLLHGSLEGLEADLGELAKRSQAFKDSLNTRGVNKNVFAVYEVELGKLLRLQDEARRRSGEAFNNPELAADLNQRRLLIGKALDKEAQTIRDALHLERTIQHAETQGAFAQRLAETKIAGQRLIQQERQSSRARIEVFRAAQRQILFLERQIADGFKGTLRIVQGAVSGVGSALGRLGGLFRRGNNDLNDGLRGALLQRESAISRSFGRQTTEVRSEISKQSRTIERFNTQTSTGIIGAATGRSSVGAALGLGAGIGGGFALFQGLRNGIKVGGDFVQGLAVLQAQLKLTDAEMASVRQQSIDLGNDITLPGVSALDAAQAIQILGKQFASLGDAALPAAQDATKGVLQLSRAAGVGAEEAARVVGAAVNVFGAEADKAVNIADQVTNALTNAAGVGFGDFADAFTQSAAVFNLFVGPSESATDAIAEFNAAIAVLAKGGLVGSDAGTSLKQFFLQAERGTVDSKKAIAQLLEVTGETGSLFFDASGASRTLSDSLDILRRGVKGLSDQARTNIFQKLFGSDAARAAGILVDLGGNFDQLVGNIKEAGAAADIAAAQNTGLRGALDALGSVIETQQIKTYEKYQGVLGEVIIKFAELLQAFFDGEGRMGVLRAAITGVVAALGGLLIVKTVAEGFKLFAIALGSVATPLGLVVTGIALLGGAIAVLRKISPDFRKETEAIADTFKGRLGDGAERVGDLLASISRLLRTEVVPRFVDFGVAVASKVLPIVDSLVGRIGSFAEAVRSSAGLQAALSGVRDVINGLRGTASISPFAFGGDEASKGEQIGIQIRRGVQTALQWLGVLRDQVQLALGTVKTALEPAITQFENLGRAIQTAFQTGDTSLLTESFAMVRDGILAAFRNIGTLIVDTVGPQLQRVTGFIADQLSPKNLERAALGVASLVFKIGETLGTIASDPRLVAALEAIVVAITVTGGLAVAGFVKGVVQNLPEIGQMLVDQFQFLFNEIFEDGINYKKIGKFFVVGLASAMVLGATIAGFSRAFKAPAEKAGREAGKGFAASMGRQLQVGLRRNDFSTTFFGGFEKFATRAGDQAAKVLAKSQARAAEELRLLSGKNNIADAFVNNKGFKAAGDDVVAQMKVIRSEMGESAVAGGILRGRLREIFTDFKNIGTGVREVVDNLVTGQSRGLEQGATQVKNASGALVKNIGRFFAEAARNAKAAGAGFGQLVGGAVLGGVSAALAGKAAGEAGGGFATGIGLAGILGSALFASAAAGGQLTGGIVGGIVGALGLISFAMGRQEAAAKKAKEETLEYTDALKGLEGLERAGAATEAVLSNIADESKAVRDTLDQVGFNARDFADEVVAGTFNMGDAFRILRPALGNDTFAIGQELIRLEGLGHSFKESFAAASDTANDPLGTFKELRRLLTSVPSGTNLGSIGDTLDALLDESSELRNGLDDAAQLDRFAANAVSSTAVAQKAFEDAQDAVSNYDLQLGRLNANEDPVAAARTRERLQLAKTSAENLVTVLGTLNEARLGAINEEIGRLTTQLDAAKQATEFAKQALTDYLTSDYADTAREAVDNVILGLGDVGTALTDLGNLDDLDLLGQVKFRQITEGFQSNLAGIIQKARADAEKAGIEFTPELLANLPEIADLRAFVSQVTIPKEVLDESTEDPDDKITIQVKLPDNIQRLLLGEIDNAINDPDLATNLENLKLSEEAEAALIAQIAELQLFAQVRAFFSEDQIRAAAAEAGLFIGAIPAGITAPLDPRLSGITDPDAIAAFLAAKAAFDAGTANGAVNPVTGGPTNILNVNQTVVTPNPIASGPEIVRSLRVAASGGQLFIQGIAFAGAA